MQELPVLKDYSRHLEELRRRYPKIAAADHPLTELLADRIAAKKWPYNKHRSVSNSGFLNLFGQKNKDLSEQYKLLPLTFGEIVAIEMASHMLVRISKRMSTVRLIFCMIFYYSLFEVIQYYSNKTNWFEVLKLRLILFFFFLLAHIIVSKFLTNMSAHKNAVICSRMIHSGYEFRTESFAQLFILLAAFVIVFGSSIYIIGWLADYNLHNHELLIIFISYNGIFLNIALYLCLIKLCSDKSVEKDYQNIVDLFDNNYIQNKSLTSYMY